MENDLQTQQSQPMTLIHMAIENKADISVIERLYEMNKDYQAQQASKAFKMAIANFQGKKPVLIKEKKIDFTTSTGSRIKYNYLPLAKLQSKIDPILSEFGLSYRWEQQDKEKMIQITCIVSHLDGHEETTHLKAPLDQTGKKGVVQQIGSTITYLKRYTLEAALGLASDDDDDGTAAKAQKPVLDMENKIFEKALEALKNGNTTIQGIENTYALTATAKEALINSIDPDELSLLFDLVQEKIPSNDIANIKRIIEQQEKGNYSKVLFTLTKLKDELV